MQNEHVDIGRVGIWTFHLDLEPATKAQEHAAEIEELGYGALWIPEAGNREAFSNASLLLAGTSRLPVATGIASVWMRTAMAMNAAHRTVNEAYPGRFLLGMGVSHQPMVDGLVGEHYDKPLSKMRTYLDQMDGSLYFGPEGAHPPQRALAALGPKMLELSAAKTAGAHPYFTTVEHTAFARERLGDAPLLAVEQAVVLETGPARARDMARKHTGIYTVLPNYTNNLRRFGFEDDDFAAAGSDRLIDAIVAWGDVDTITERVRAQFDAGADHVCIQVIASRSGGVPTDAWRELAPALLSL